MSRKGFATNSNYGGDDTFASSALKAKIFQRNSSVEPYQSNHSVQRTNQIYEIGDLKHRLTKQDIN